MASGFRLAETTKRLKRLEFYIQSPRLQSTVLIVSLVNLESQLSLLHPLGESEVGSTCPVDYLLAIRSGQTLTEREASSGIRDSLRLRTSSRYSSRTPAE